MNRRSLFARLGGIAAAAVVAPAVEALPIRVRSIEPVPTRLDFERIFPVEVDVSTCGVAHALAHLGWSSDDHVLPLLCVHTADLGAAVYIKEALGHSIAVHATSKLPDRDSWFVAWRGRRVGSVGA